jgi:hypothetical protein
MSVTYITAGYCHISRRTSMAPGSKTLPFASNSISAASTCSGTT